MTILTALASLYDRMAADGEAPRRGYSIEKIGAEVVFDRDGGLVAIRPRLKVDGKKLVPDQIAVPAAVKRSSGIAPNFLWDKTAYALGVTAAKDDKGKPLLEEGRQLAAQEGRTAREHAAFVERQSDRLSGLEDEGAQAFLRFLKRWSWEDFARLSCPAEVLDQNVVFRLEGDARLLHDRPALAGLLAGGDGGEAGPLCLITGTHASVARLHPSIKGVMGAQSSGASLVSFNDTAFESFGKKQGENAPVSEAAAFAYGTALNALLARSGKGPGRRALRIGDATVVFWAETPDRGSDSAAEDLLAGLLDPVDDTETETEGEAAQKLQVTLEALAKGQQPDDPRFHPDTRVYVLGLSPNAARLSVRFWLPGTLGGFTRNLMQFQEELRLEPAAWRRPPALWALLYETALQHKAENIPPLLGGEMMRAVLGGLPYPRLLLAAVIGRIRADGIVNGPRAAICKAYLTRNLKEEMPVSLDPDNPDPAYRLGRLFAVLEQIQLAALPGLNATIRDRYFAAASATPARVFPLLVKTATHHLSNLRKGDKGGLAHWFDAQMGQVWAGLPPDLPGSLTLEAQGRFVAGYYHQKFTKKTTEEVVEEQSNGTPA